MTRRTFSVGAMVLLVTSLAAKPFGQQALSGSATADPIPGARFNFVDTTVDGLPRLHRIEPQHEPTTP